MRFTSAISMLTLAPAAIHAFHVGSTTTTANPTGITSTSLEARRLMVPMLRRSRPSSSMFFPDVDRMFREMDEMMESSFSELSRPASSMLALGKYPQAQGLGLRQPLGFDVTQDEKEFKVAMNLGDVELKDIDLQLDADGRVLRLKGNKVQEEGGMKIQSSFEKAILLHPNVDTEKISAKFDGGVLSIVAPKVYEEVVEEKKPKKIDIHVTDSASEEVKAAIEDHVEAPEENEVPSAPTHLAIENMKNQKVDTKKNEAVNKEIPEKKWPVRDFPY
jgi:HSP20 family protein